jgi:hypothetical protein
MCVITEVNSEVVLLSRPVLISSAKMTFDGLTSISPVVSLRYERAGHMSREELDVGKATNNSNMCNYIGEAGFCISTLAWCPAWPVAEVADTYCRSDRHRRLTSHMWEASSSGAPRASRRRVPTSSPARSGMWGRWRCACGYGASHCQRAADGSS